MFLESCLTVLSIADTASKVYDWFTGVSTGDQLKQTLATLEKAQTQVQRLSDHILYAPTLQQAVSFDQSALLSNGRDIRSMLDPVAESMHTGLLTTAVVSTPAKLKAAFNKNPWEVLVEVRPVDRAKPPSNPDLVPIVFTDGGRPYVGWQTRGALPVLFDCDFDNTLISSSQKDVPLPQTISPPLLTARSKPVISKGAPDLGAAIYKVLQRHPKSDGFFVAPHIPAHKSTNAIEKCRVTENDTILALVDCTVFGSAKNCLLFTLSGVYYHNDRSGKRPGSGFISYKEFTRRKLGDGGYGEVSLDGGESLNISGSAMSKAQVLQLLEAVRKCAWQT
ncbi:MAG TPA: hypothetical protein VLK84_25640 [Longimicrobium sp.]|nr:hypothetical protein [Longimicrobium sp.]